MYLASNAMRSLFACGMTNRFRARDRSAISVAENMYGTISLWKLIPQLRIATISESEASFEVKKITVMNTNKGLNMFIKYGMKFR